MTVNAGIATTTTLTSSTNPSVFGQSVTFTATVTPSSGSGTPTGSVTFYAGSTALGTATLSGKKASLKTTSVPVGSQAITAVYSGDTNYAPSTSAVLDPDGEPGLDNDQSDFFGESVGLWTVRDVHGDREGGLAGKWHADRHGDVLRRHDESRQRHSQRRVRPLFSTTFFVVGSHSITADYSGDPNFTASTSSALTQTVNQASTTTVVVSAVNPVGLRAAVDVHGDGERKLARERNADRHGHVLRRLDAARHGYAQRAGPPASPNRRSFPSVITPSRRPTAETPTSRRARGR